MKTIVTLCALTLLFSGLNAQTTLEEYNYLTKGYKIQVESGLDQKKGYTFTDLFEYSTPGLISRKIIGKALYRDGKTGPCAILLIYTNSQKGEAYICVPHQLSDRSIWDLYYNSMSNFQKEPLQLIAFATGRAAAYFAQNN